MLRETKKARTRAALSAAALELFTARGYASVTLTEIAAAAGVSERTLFRYCADKEEVLFGEDDLFRAALDDGLAARPADEKPLLALAAAAGTLLEGLETRRDEFAQRTAVIDATPQLLARERAKQAGFEAVLAAGLGDRGLARLEARLLARVAVACYDEAVRAWIADGSSSTLASHFADMLRAVRQALGAR